MSDAWGGRKVARLLSTVLATYGAVCHLCLRPISLGLPPGDKRGPSVDHVIPRSMGGDHGLDNLRPAHRSCNSARGAKALTSELLASFRRPLRARESGAAFFLVTPGKPRPHLPSPP